MSGFTIDCGDKEIRRACVGEAYSCARRGWLHCEKDVFALERGVFALETGVDVVERKCACVRKGRDCVGDGVWKGKGRECNGNESGAQSD